MTVSSTIASPGPGLRTGLLTGLLATDGVKFSRVMGGAVLMGDLVGVGVGVAAVGVGDVGWVTGDWAEGTECAPGVID